MAMEHAREIVYNWVGGVVSVISYGVSLQVANDWLDFFFKSLSIVSVVIVIFINIPAVFRTLKKLKAGELLNENKKNANN